MLMRNCKGLLCLPISAGSKRLCLGRRYLSCTAATDSCLLACANLIPWALRQLIPRLLHLNAAAHAEMHPPQIDANVGVLICLFVPLCKVAHSWSCGWAAASCLCRLQSGNGDLKRLSG